MRKFINGRLHGSLMGTEDVNPIEKMILLHVHMVASSLDHHTLGKMLRTKE